MSGEVIAPATNVNGVSEMLGSGTSGVGIVGAGTMSGSVGSQWNSLRLRSMNAACCSSVMRPQCLRKKYLSPARLASLPGVDNLGRSLSA